MQDLTKDILALSTDLPITQDLDLAKILQKKLVLYFYPKDLTPGCSLEAQDFNRLYGEFKANDIEVIGVSLDNLAKHEKFCTKFSLEFPLISDENHKLCDLFAVYKLKKSYGKEYYGIERSSFYLHNGIVQKAWRKVKVADHAQAVLNHIKEL